jgi:Protein of unknown function (DUF3429)
MTQSTFLRILPYAGTLPFIYGAVSRFSGGLSAMQHFRLFADMQHMILSYGLFIISSMVGVHWGQYLAGFRPRINFLLSSNIVALLAWFCYLELRPFELLLVFSGIFVGHYFIDLQSGIDGWYMQTQRNVTAIVFICLLVVTFT